MRNSSDDNIVFQQKFLKFEMQEHYDRRRLFI